ncbi:MAG TPA: AAA family ATPase [Actinospica sp.]|jgi:DNA-binding CsgD family transcriptional regulator|nr:AAA family ATPase [Actinospica sp.]
MSFVGRDTEIRVIQETLDALEGGVGGLLQVVGEPGIGKTRLLTVIRDLATERGIRVEVLRSFFEDAAEPTAEVEAHRSEPGGDGGRFRLFQELRRTLLAAASRPLVMLLDDVHWVDGATIDFLEFLSRRPIPAPLLLVIASRDRQTPPRLRYALARIADHDSGGRIELGPLAHSEAASLIGVRPRSPRIDELYAESGGNPLYLMTLDRNDNCLQSLVLGEITALSPGERTVASIAAVLGDPLSPTLLAEVAAGGSDDVEAALATLIERDLIRPVAGGPTFAFRHPLVRRAVYDSTPPTWRIAVHRRALTLLTRDAAAAVELAGHIEQCVDTYSAEHFAVLLQAGQDTMRSAPLTAAHWFQAALRLLPQTAEFAASRRTTESRLARALCLGGRFEASRELLHDILHSDDAGVAVDRGQTVVLLAHVERLLGRYPEALALLRTEVARLTPAPPSPERVRLCSELGLTAALANDYPSARADLCWARDVARGSEDLLGEATALAFQSFGEICTGETAAARAAADRAGVIVDALPDGVLSDGRETLCMLGWAELLLERFADAERHLARARTVIGRTGHRDGLPHVLVGQALVDLSTGHRRSALERAEQAEDAARLVGGGHLLGIALAVRATILLDWSRSGQDDSALKAARRATELFGGSALGSWWGRHALMVRGWAESSAGDARACVEYAIRASGPDLRLLGASLVPQYCEVLVSALLRLGDVQRAMEFATLATESADRLGLPGQSAYAARAQGLVAAARGEHERAATEFAAAAAGFAASGRVLERAPVRVTPPPGPLTVLTGREREVADLAGAGRSNRQIATRLRLSERTVESHLANVYRKLGVASRLMLAKLLTGEQELARIPE